MAAVCAVPAGAHGGPALAATTPTSVVPVAALTVTTPFPDIETQPGSTVRLDVDVASPTVAPVDIAVGGVPDGWKSTLRGGGFVIHSITATPDGPVKATLELDVATDAPAGRLPDQRSPAPSGDDKAVRRRDARRRRRRSTTAIQVTADFPSLEGRPGERRSPTTSRSPTTRPEQQTFTFDPTAPAGVDGDRLAHGRGEGRDRERSMPADRATVQGDRDPAGHGRSRARTRSTSTVTAANGATGKIELQPPRSPATPMLALGTADQRLDVVRAAPTASTGSR